MIKNYIFRRVFVVYVRLLNGVGSFNVEYILVAARNKKDIAKTFYLI